MDEVKRPKGRKPNREIAANYQKIDWGNSIYLHRVVVGSNPEVSKPEAKKALAHRSAFKCLLSDLYSEQHS